ncbi:hypothetical protein [Sphingomonas albertensis]|uniref:HNH endonuclease n=1 Tax=Sphingomonas albertensis TaxID=2762591 RepID=A0ABR7AS96_9SPHN|nr:hypothetical protein [Sphingomonas albertensis]MBC3943335.1 hypothetical protein [Sphingomonas albertensis]
MAWNSSCPRCVASKFACDDHYVPSTAAPAHWNSADHIRDASEAELIGMSFATRTACMSNDARAELDRRAATLARAGDA